MQIYLARRESGLCGLVDHHPAFVDTKGEIPSQEEKLAATLNRGFTFESSLQGAYMINDPEKKAEHKAEEKADAPQEGGYARNEQGHFTFDPHKELNLPSSYDEVVSRFNRLQGDRAMEVLN